MPAGASARRRACRAGASARRRDQSTVATRDAPSTLPEGSSACAWTYLVAGIVIAVSKPVLACVASGMRVVEVAPPSTRQAVIRVAPLRLT